MNETLQNMMAAIKEKAGRAGVVVENAVNSAGKKTTEIVETTKINLHIVDLQSKAKDVCRAIGELVYTAHKNPNTDTERVDSLLEQLDELHEEIGEYRDRYNEIRQQKQCGQCGKSMSRQDEFCRFCGGKAPEAEGEQWA